MLKLRSRVCGAGGGHDAGETMNGVGEGDVVDLEASESKRSLAH
jgi:hypothetical protein